jgi:hypothetical protein
MSKHLNLFTLFICLIFFLAPLFIFSQPKDTTSNTNDSLNIVTKDTLKVFGTFENDFDFCNVGKNYFEIDTLLSDFQKNENFYHSNPFFAKSSNSGLAERDLIFQNEYDYNQISSHKYFSHYFYNNANAKYYNTINPFSNAFYMMGPKREQVFDFFFTRNFGKYINAAVDYSLLYSPGRYKNQKSNDNFVNVTSNFHSKNKKYMALANYFYNRMKIQENGGIANDSDFIQKLTSNQLMDVNLNNDKTNIIENRVKESGIYFRQYYFPGYTLNKKDTIKDNQKYIAFGRFSYSVLFRNEKESYYDDNPASGFYQNIFFPDSAVTHDSLQVNFIENKIEWSNIHYYISDSLEQHFVFSIGAKHQKQHIYNLDTVLNFHTIIPEMKCRIDFDPIVVSIYGFFVTSGFNKNDYSCNAEADYKLSDKNDNPEVISIGASSISQTPCWFDQHYSSNNFHWDYEFEKISMNNLFLKYTGSILTSEISFLNIENPVFYDDYAMPRQLNRSNQIIQFKVKKVFKWKKWSMDNDIIYQRNTGTDVIRLPEFISNHSLFFSKDLFKKALSAQFGTEITFFSSYYPLAYMPATRQFYLQNDFKSAAYPYIDIFMNLKIKRVRIFLKLDHVNSGMMGYDYFLIPHYPMSDRSLKFGLSWIFYN